MGTTMRARRQNICTPTNLWDSGYPEARLESGGADPVHHVDRLEHILGELLARCGEMLQEGWEHARRHVRTDNLAVLVDSGLLVHEDVLQAHLVVLAPEHLGDAHDLARAVAETGLLDDHVDRRADLLADCA